MALGDVVDELHDDDRFADTGSTKRADLATLGEGTDQVDDFDARFQDIRLGILINQRRRRAMNGILLGEFDRTALIGGFADDVEDTAKDALTNGNRNRRGRVKRTSMPR